MKKTRVTISLPPTNGLQRGCFASTPAASIFSAVRVASSFPRVNAGVFPRVNAGVFPRVLAGMLVGMIAGVFPGSLPTAHAQTLDPSTFNSKIAPSYDPKATSGLAGILTSCTANSMIGMATSLLQTKGKGAMGISIQTKCDTTEAGVTDEPNCSQLQTVDALQAMLKRNKKAEAGYACQRNKLQAIRGELGCLSDQAGALTQKLSSLQTIYSQNIQKMQKDVTDLTAIETERQTQLGVINERINGNPSTGKKGLREIKATLDKMVAGMPTEIEGFKKAQSDQLEQRKQLDEIIKNRKMGLANACFKTNTNPSFQCVANGPPVSAVEYAVCRYRQNQHIGNNEKIERDASTRAKATGMTQGLQSIIAAMINDTSHDTDVPISPDNTMKLAAAGASKGILTPDQLKTKYESQLRAYNGKGLNISTFLFNEFQKCYTTAERQVDKERTQPTSMIYKNQDGIKSAEKALSAARYGKIEEYSKFYADAMATLTGQHLPLNTAGCQSATPAAQSSCFDRVYANIRSISNGQDDNSIMSQTIEGSNPKMSFQIKCRGIDGCLTSYQSVATNLQKEKEKVSTYKKDYISKANASTMAFTQSISQKLGYESQALQDRQKVLNDALASLGLRTRLKIGNVEKESLKIGKDGLYETPSSIKNVVGSMMTPPMLDITADSFSDALGGIADATKDFEEKGQRVAAMTAALPGIKAKCDQEKLDKISETLDDDIAKFNDSCLYLEDFCEKNADSIDRLGRSINSILEKAEGKNMDTSAITSLQGVGDACSNTEGENSSERLACSRSNPESELRKAEDAKLKAKQDAKVDGKDCKGVIKEYDRLPELTRANLSIAGAVGTGVTQDERMLYQQQKRCGALVAEVEKIDEEIKALVERCKNYAENQNKGAACKSAYNKIRGKADAVTRTVRDGGDGSKANGVD